MREARVEVHITGLDDVPVERLTWLLDEDERARADRFIFPRDRQRYIAAHAALRLVLAKESGMAATSLRFVTGQHGKPRLQDAPDIGFNLSHSGECALVAVSRGLAIGVDLEAIRPDVEPTALGKRFFSAAEQAELIALPVDQRVRGFFNAWTRKEAYLKGRGDGITFGLDHFDVALTPDAPAALRADRRDPGAARTWSVTDLPVPPGFVGALALEGATPRVTFHGSPSRWNL